MVGVLLPVRNRDPHAVRNLRADLVDAERRDERHDRVRHPCADGGDVVMPREVGVRAPIETPPFPFNEPGSLHAPQTGIRDTGHLGVLRTEAGRQPGFAEQSRVVDGPVGQGRLRKNTSHLGTDIDIFFALGGGVKGLSSAHARGIAYRGGSPPVFVRHKSVEMANNGSIRTPKTEPPHGDLARGVG